jgi:hypothetical protein
MNATKTNQAQTGVKKMTKAQMVRKDNDHARTIANGFLCSWVAENCSAATAGNIPTAPTPEAWDMFREECYPKFSTAAFTAQWTADRAELLS